MSRISDGSAVGMQDVGVQDVGVHAKDAADDTSAPSRRYEERYEAEWNRRFARGTATTAIEEELRLWCKEIFSDVSATFLSPVSECHVPCIARFHLGRKKINWFTNPQHWNPAQKGVLQHALGHDPDKLATHTFRDNQTWVNFYLNFGANPCLKRFPQSRIYPGSAIVGIQGSGKTITLCAPERLDLQAGFVVKSSAFEDGLLKEMLCLRQLPKSLHCPREQGISLGEINQGRNETGRKYWEAVYRHQNLQTLMAGYTLHTIPRIYQLLPLAAEFLMSLVEQDAQPTSLSQQADQLRQEIDDSRIYPGLKLKLEELLDRVHDTTPLQPSRMHGDFRPANLLALPDDPSFEDASFSFELGAVDWELSRPGRLGLLDFIQLATDRINLNKCDLKDFADADTLSALGSALEESGLPGHNLPLEQVLALQLATFCFDRAWGFGGESRGKGYEQALSHPWPFN